MHLPPVAIKLGPEICKNGKPRDVQRLSAAGNVNETTAESELEDAAMCSKLVNSEQVLHGTATSQNERPVGTPNHRAPSKFGGSMSCGMSRCVLIILSPNRNARLCCPSLSRCQVTRFPSASGRNHSTRAGALENRSVATRSCDPMAGARPHLGVMLGSAGPQQKVQGWFQMVMGQN